MIYCKRITMPGNTHRHIPCPLQGYHPDDIQKGMCSRRLTVYKPLFFEILLKFLLGTQNFLPLLTSFRRNTKSVCSFSQHIMHFLSIDCQILKGSDHEYSLCKSMPITITITLRHSIHRCRMNGRA